MIEPSMLIILGLVGFAAGFIDAVAGGGGMLTVPALLSLGLPPHIALGTNKLAATFASSTAAWMYYRKQLFSPSFWRFSFAATLIGATSGTLVVDMISTEWLEKVLPLIILAVAVVIAGLMALTRGDVAYLLVLVWAFAGIALKHAGVAPVAIGAWVSTALVAVLALLSLVRPGRGQFYQSKWTRGGIFSVATTVAVFVSLDYLNRYDQAVNLYELQVEYFNTARTVEEREAISRSTDAYWADVEKTRRWRNISFGILAGIWAAGVIDTFIPGQEDAPATDLSLDAGPNHVALVYRF